MIFRQHHVISVVCNTVHCLQHGPWSALVLLFLWRLRRWFSTNVKLYTHLNNNRGSSLPQSLIKVSLW